MSLIGRLMMAALPALALLPAGPAPAAVVGPEECTVASAGVETRCLIAGVATAGSLDVHVDGLAFGVLGVELHVLVRDLQTDEIIVECSGGGSAQDPTEVRCQNAATVEPTPPVLLAACHVSVNPGALGAGTCRIEPGLLD